MLGSLTRYDLVVIGVSYLILSWMKVSGIYSLLINAILLLILKLIKGKVPRGFFQNLRSESLLKTKDIQKLFLKKEDKGLQDD